jgi:hypothetical protein
MAKYGSTGMAFGDQSQLDATRAQVNEVQNIMKVNVDKIMEREAKLGDLEDRADQLKAFQFKNRTYVYDLKAVGIILTKQLTLFQPSRPIMPPYL